MRDALLELVPVRAALAVVEAPQLREVRVLRRQHALVLVLDQLAGEVVQLCNSVENKYIFSPSKNIFMSSIPARSPVCLLGSEAPSSLTLSAYLSVLRVCSHEDMLGAIMASWRQGVISVKLRSG